MTDASTRTTPPQPSTLHTARFDELTALQLYGILRVRSEVFVLEQDCVYLDIDGRDLQPGALQLWHEVGGEVVATLRVLHAGDERVIGRVATLLSARGRGLAGELMRAAIASCAGHAIEISAQAYLERWYSGFGFVRYGDEYLEDNIPHVAMHRAAE